ncbi:unnamed protein product [Boreogadus saida]
MVPSDKCLLSTTASNASEAWLWTTQGKRSPNYRPFYTKSKDAPAGSLGALLRVAYPVQPAAVTNSGTSFHPRPSAAVDKPEGAPDIPPGMLGPSAPSSHIFPLSSEERVRECLWSGVASVVHLSASTGALCSASTHLPFPLLSSPPLAPRRLKLLLEV